VSRVFLGSVLRASDAMRAYAPSPADACFAAAPDSRCHCVGRSSKGMPLRTRGLRHAKRLVSTGLGPACVSCMSTARQELAVFLACRTAGHGAAAACTDQAVEGHSLLCNGGKMLWLCFFQEGMPDSWLQPLC
jgi:hypothetical protein